MERKDSLDKTVSAARSIEKRGAASRVVPWRQYSRCCTVATRRSIGDSICRWDQFGYKWLLVVAVAAQPAEILRKDSRPGNESGNPSRRRFVPGFQRHCQTH